MNFEYREFLEIEANPVPPRISERVLEHVHRSLNPSGFFVFSKMLMVHLVVAALTLSVCPQLGFRLLGEGMGLMHYFMGLGYYGCMMACGGFFLGMSMLVTAAVLRPEELKVLRKTRWLEVGSLAVLSFGFFFVFNPEIVLGIALAWLFGAMGSALLVLELGWRVRVRRFAIAAG